MQRGRIELFQKLYCSLTIKKHLKSDGTAPTKRDTRKTLLLNSSKIELGVFYYAQKSIFL